jgi:two-component system CheB/CheR fusion protein
MPADTGMTFVLVQHLDPHHASMLVELLAPHTAMPVSQAVDGEKVVGNHVYVIPPNATLTIEKGVLKVQSPAPAREHRRPIDSFSSRWPRIGVSRPRRSFFLGSAAMAPPGSER